MLNKTKAALQSRSSNTTNNSQNTNMLVLHSQDDKRDLVNSGQYSCLIAMFPDNFGLPNTISTPKYFGIAYRGKAAPKFLGRAKNAKSHSAHNPFLSMKSVGTKLRRVHSPKYLGQCLDSMPNLRNFSLQASFIQALKFPIDEGVCTEKSATCKPSSVVVHVSHKLKKAQGAKKHLGYNSLYLKQSVKLRCIQSPKYLGQLLGFLRCLRLISPCRAVTINCPVLSPISLTKSISLTTSCGILTDVFCDLLLMLPVAMTISLLNRCPSLYMEVNQRIVLTCPSINNKVSVTRLCLMTLEITKPGSVGTLTGLLTTNDKTSIEVAMYKYTFLIGKGKARLSDINPIRLISADFKSDLCRLQSKSKSGYIHGSPAQSGAGFDSLNNHADIHRTKRFFYVRSKLSYAHIMVGRSGGASALAGFMIASLSTLLRLTTPFDSGLVRFKKPNHEAVIMTATPTRIYFKFLFLAVLRADTHSKPHRQSIIATDEHTARQQLANRFVLSFAGRLPVQEVSHA